MPDTVAVIDVGSNSIKLLVARVGATPLSLETLFSETIETRISAGISRELPSLTDEAIQAGAQTISELQGMAQSYQPSQTAIVATSAVRDAINGDAFVQAVYQATGLQIRILSGTEEATYIGHGLNCDPAVAGVPRFIQSDIGGGSLELIRFEHGQIQQAISLQLGAVRLSEQFIKDKEAPLSAEIEQAIRQHVIEQLTRSGFDFQPHELPLIATGGAYTVSRAVLAAQSNCNIEQSPPQLERSTLNQLKKQLAPLTLHQRLSIPHLPAARADIIPTALITIDALLEVAGRSSLTHSFYNLRYGIAANLLKL
ncbi:MAG TPA: phosphatase [Opitutae bacterium]|nr:phosphatase [Puniceicoccaceae bacterium]HBR93222.1 phosphatase [Opitutae bacterium]|tara:strand:+ start:2444 stop:3379 length:936 start_codon:yes stop_codon:yes gene_type:complete